jgi:hypothetical protein
VTLRVAAGAAVAAVVLGGGFAAIRLAGSTGTSGASGSSAANSTSSGGGASGAGAQRSQAAAAPAAVPAPTLTYRAGGQPRPFTVLVSSDDLGPGNLGRKIGQLVPGSESSPEPASTRARPRQPGGTPGFAPAALEACVTRVADGGQVQLVTIGRYQGQRAAIIVVSPAGGGPARIWVVGTGCSATSPDVITQMALPGSG